jgi:hypothetical protein
MSFLLPEESPFDAVRTSGNTPVAEDSSPYFIFIWIRFVIEFRFLFLQWNGRPGQRNPKKMKKKNGYGFPTVRPESLGGLYSTWRRLKWSFKVNFVPMARMAWLTSAFPLMGVAV